MAPERAAVPAAAVAAARHAPSSPKESPAAMTKRLMQGLRTDTAEQAAGLVASFDLAAAPAAADGVAAEVGMGGRWAGKQGGRGVPAAALLTSWHARCMAAMAAPDPPGATRRCPACRLVSIPPPSAPAPRPHQAGLH